MTLVAGSGEASVVRVNRSWFDFTCPACGQFITEDQPVWSLPISALVTWPVCEDCGLSWISDQQS